MQLIFLDFETYYDKEYSLRKMTPVEYILDPRFEMIGCAVKEGLHGKTVWMLADTFKAWLATKDPADCQVVSHNFLFDGCILSWRYGFVPRLMTDTLGISRALFGAFLRSCSLASVAAYLGLKAKGTFLGKVMGMSAQQIIDAGMMDDFADYAIDDADICAGIYEQTVLTGKFPAMELVIMDTVLRMAVVPQFQLDQNMLAKHAFEVSQAKELLLTNVAGFGEKADLMSNDKFAAMLVTLGVDPPRKISLKTGLETWAFAKTDQAFTDLEEHDDPDVQALMAARFGIKSTLEETRTRRFTSISNLIWPDGSALWLPIALKFSGAHTHRLSGDWKLNEQNLRRGGNLRKSLKAPPGKKVYAIDSSQIEARMVAAFCGQHDLVKQFADGEDVYSSFAALVFGYLVNKRDNPDERFVGKTGVLGLGFGVGWQKFQSAVRSGSKQQLGREVLLSDEQAQGVVDTYRTRYSSVPRMWRKLGYEMIPAMMNKNCNITLGPITFLHEKILLPSGLHLHYHNLHQKQGEWWFEYGGKPQRIYGGKLLENIIQALARIVTMEACVRIVKRMADFGTRLAHQVHDELIFVVPDNLVPILETFAMEEMRRVPIWMPNLPLAAESGAGANYGDAK